MPAGMLITLIFVPLMTLQLTHWEPGQTIVTQSGQFAYTLPLKWTRLNGPHGQDDPQLPEGIRLSLETIQSRQTGFHCLVEHIETSERVGVAQLVRAMQFEGGQDPVYMLELKTTDESLIFACINAGKNVCVLRIACSDDCIGFDQELLGIVRSLRKCDGQPKNGLTRNLAGG